MREPPMLPLGEDDEAIGAGGRAGEILRAALGAVFRERALSRRHLALLALCVLFGWGAAGIYKVAPDEQGMVLRFGRWRETTAPGLHYHLPPPLERVILAHVTSINEIRISEAKPQPAGGAAGAGGIRMLTGDENIVEAEYSVLWKIKDAGAYLFHIQDPEALVRMTAETAVREVIGRNPIQAALSEERQRIAAEAQAEQQALLDSYGAGILVIEVQLQRVDPPTAVIDAFNDVQRARADQQRARNEAEAYRNDILPRARGEATRITEAAEAYRRQVVALAEGEVSAYHAAHDVYLRAPEVFSWRLYLDSMDALLAHAGRVVLDPGGKGMGAVVPYLPLGEGPGAKAEAAPATIPGHAP
ncbi:FtsH protease activity modulator HflK [Acidibrevibacterium fodinaquatile]|uniref:FtsH protease activity modulator HflK n=1 Tax=Acidibrevibacterium fodinaquatile TaxID=1969806 RepID=UPI001F076CD0|nr:FtsH protease activity modulator HflK [Acidibrevibacterium fodinaquatile]